ncbi:hypothetical protein [Sulfurimonas sp.]|jgi:phosphate transport system substrate-binding protein|uniref:hypothetical protein n=1 Tax=Sulfurimonas sp. TaxID=2022749 RepID=UPI0025E8D500|nr:hypothetical protein [Sulfurimonas sp.]MBT5934659.1 hypothetical protein [Sulfurimonas sp.]
MKLILGSYLAATFILVPSEKPEMNKRVTAFYEWCYKDGQEIAKSLGFVLLAESLRGKIQNYWIKKVYNNTIII